MKQLPVNRTVRFKTEYVREDGYLGTGFKFGEYYIKYLNNGQERACSWQYLKRKRTVGLFLNRTYDLGYVDMVKISMGEDKLENVKCKIYHKPPEYDELDDSFDLQEEEEGWYQTERPEIVKGKSNSVTLSWDNGDKKLLFFNNSDQKNTKLVISKGDKLIFRRDI